MSEAPVAPPAFAVLSALPQPLVVADGAGRIAWANEAFAAHWGLGGADAAGGRSVEEFLRDPDGAALPAGALPAGAAWTGPARAVGRPAGAHPVDLDVRPIEHDGGTFRLYAIADARARLQAVEALASAEDRLRRGEEAAQLGYWEWDLRTGEPRWSTQVFHIVGRAPDRVTGLRRASLRVIHPEDLRWVHSAILDEVKDGASFSLECRIRRPSGEIRHALIEGGIEIAPDGSSERIVGVVMDVTERRLLAEELRQAQKMHAIGRLAGGVAHDFNNLLTSIMGGIDLLRGDDALAEDVRVDLDEVADAVARAAELTGQLLTFARKVPERAATMDAARTLGVLERMLRRILPERIRLVAEIAPAPAPVHLDATRLEQVVLNLAVNARDAIEGEGAIYLGAGLRDLALGDARLDPGMEPGPYVVIEMGDTGRGMDPETLANCFDPFFTTKQSGTGLGLANVRRVVADAGGSLRVESEPGRGTTFWVHLPAAVASAEGTAEAKAPAPVDGERVLVVEDDEMVRSLTRRALETAGYRVEVALDGREGLAAAQRGGFDLVITDVGMPEMGGAELARRIRALGVAAPILFVTGHSEGELEGLDLTLYGGVLRKPYDVNRLVQAVEEALAPARARAGRGALPAGTTTVDGAPSLRS